MKKIFVFFPLLLFSFYSPAQNKAIDSLQNLLNKIEVKDTSYLNVYNELTFQNLLSNPKKAQSMVSRAIELADSLKFQKGLIRALVNKGNTFWLSSTYDQALTYYFKAQEELDEETDPVNSALIYNNIAEVFKKKSQHDSSLVYHHKALRQIKKLEDFNALVIYNIAETHFLLNNYDSAEYYYNQALEFSTKMQDTRAKSYSYFGLGTLAEKEGKFEVALSYYKQSLELSQQLHDIRSIIQASGAIASLLDSKEKYQEAMMYYDEAEQLAERIDATDLKYEILLSKSNHYYLKGEYKESVKLLRAYNELKDSIDQEYFNRQTDQIKYALNAEIKEYENKILLNEQKKNEAFIRMQSVMISIIAVILIILLYFLYRYYQSITRIKKSSIKLDNLNQQVTSKNDEILKMNHKLDMQLKVTNKILSENEKLTKHGGWHFDVETNEMFWTEEVFRQLGKDPRKSKAQIELLLEVMSQKEAKKIENGIVEVLSSKKPQTINVKIEKDPENVKYINIRMIPDIENGKVRKIYGSNHEVTELVQNKNKEKKIIESLLDLSKNTHLISNDFNGFIEAVLRKAANTIGLNTTSFWLYNKMSGTLHCYNKYISDSDSFVVAPTIIAEDFPIYFESIEKHRTITSDELYKNCEEHEFTKYFEVNGINRILDSQVNMNGEMVGILCFEKYDTQEWSLSDKRFSATVADIISNAFFTHQNKELEKEKAELIDKLIKKNQNLREFAYVISHNLRDPVSQILGFTDLFNKPGNEDIQNDMIDWIRKSALNLDTIIKDLTIVLNQQDSTSNVEEKACIRESVQSVMTSLENEIKKVNPDIKHKYSDDMCLPIQKSYLYNIIYNLTSNSLKYRNPDKKLEISIMAEHLDHSIQLKFTDNGLGFDSSKFGDKIFKMYQRFHLEKEGRGLGLYLVKSQIESVGGSIDVCSTPGVGTTFTIDLPIKADEVAIIN